MPTACLKICGCRHWCYGNGAFWYGSLDGKLWQFPPYACSHICIFTVILLIVKTERPWGIGSFSNPACIWSKFCWPVCFTFGQRSGIFHYMFLDNRFKYEPLALIMLLFLGDTKQRKLGKAQALQFLRYKISHGLTMGYLACRASRPCGPRVLLALVYSLGSCALNYASTWPARTCMRQLEKCRLQLCKVQNLRDTMINHSDVPTPICPGLPLC